jgi:SAC3 family protein LENG8/THP3
MEMESLRVMREMTEEEKKDECIEHAMQVRSALARGNYVRFFKLYLDAPNMGKYLMDVFIEKHRILCLRSLCLANSPSNIEIDKIFQILAFEDRDTLISFLNTLGKYF